MQGARVSHGRSGPVRSASQPRGSGPGSQSQTCSTRTAELSRRRTNVSSPLRRITVTNQPGSNARAVSEIVLGLAINTLRRLVELDRRLRRGEYLPNIDWMAETIDDKVVGLVGMGDIARETAKKFWGAYESPILVHSPTSPAERWTDKDPSGLPPIPHRRVASLEELLSQSDIVSLHCPLFESTRNMISTAQLAMMKPTAVLINTARGGLIDEQALLAALKARTIYGAGLDVLCSEPATKEVYQELYDQENVVVLPHAGAGTERVQIDSCEVAVMTAWSFLRGEGLGRSKRVV